MDMIVGFLVLGVAIFLVGLFFEIRNKDKR